MSGPFFRESAGPAGGGRKRRAEVVLVHGLGLSGRYMLPVAACLAARYRVLRPDLPGFGDSGHPARVLDVPALADALAAWMRAMSLRRAALIGNSFGCRVIADLAARHHGCVARAVLQGADDASRRALVDFGSSCAGARISRSIRARSVRSRGAITANAAGAACFRRSTTRCAIRWRPSSRAFEAPFWSCADSSIRSAGVPGAEQVVRLLPRGRLVEIPGVAHTLVHTAPTQPAAAAEPFLDETELAPAREQARS
jgi:2-hydroxy-6-oxonona-2,4-dienedioate hydrolase